MTLVWILTVAFAGWFGFCLGRKWDDGEREVEQEIEEERRAARPGVKLRTISIRR